MKWSKEKTKEEIIKVEEKENCTFFGKFIKDGFPEYIIDWKTGVVKERLCWKDTVDPFSNYEEYFWSDRREVVTPIKEYDVDLYFYLYLYQRHVLKKWREYEGEIDFRNVDMEYLNEENLLKDINNPSKNEYLWVHSWL
ncbi:TPA: hypothetical protein PTV74_003299 [Clostridium botulinum]|nr:hypothetical protein [Clostridium botulinum]HDK7206454.1 hypothetical protein [Clostridium botulinum]HDK7210189.1 hypothetical protein [Clostridium botulinum]HDK7265639.1 hypothetical protein [Clostridium botulinum]HDK7269486.1 hypothetical protein [Clostridium botulinum]